MRYKFMPNRNRDLPLKADISSQSNQNEEEESDVEVVQKKIELNVPIDSLSPHENRMLGFDYWFNHQVGNSKSSETHKNAERFLLSCLHQIRLAYVSIRNSEDNDIVHILEDSIAMCKLFQIGFAICRLNEYLIILKSMLSTLSAKDLNGVSTLLQNQIQTSPLLQTAQSPFPKPNDKIDEHGQDFSVRLHRILLLGCDILIQLGLLPALSEGLSEHLLMLNLVNGVKRLRVDIRDIECELVDTIKKISGVYSSCSSEYDLCFDVVKRVHKSTSRLALDVVIAGGYLKARNRDISFAFRNVISILNLSHDPLSGDNDYYYVRFLRFLEGMQMRGLQENQEKFTKVKVPNHPKGMRTPKERCKRLRMSYTL